MTINSRKNKIDYNKGIGLDVVRGNGKSINKPSERMNLGAEKQEESSSYFVDSSHSSDIHCQIKKEMQTK